MKYIHFIGIGGISMSSLASILKSRGYRVSGSDMKESAITESLRQQGIEVMIGQRTENIRPDMDEVVFTAAIHEDNPELMEARRQIPRVIERAVLLGEIMSQYLHSFGVAGTHGKTSTSTMLSYIFMAAGLDPTISIGGILTNIQSNYRIGNSDYFIAEACEYTDSFLHFHPETGIVTNIEAEHLDYFGTYDRIVQSFRKYVYGFKEGGNLIVNYEYAHLFPDYTGHVTTVSLTEAKADLHAGKITVSNHSLCSTFECYYHGERLGELTIHVPGNHLVFDALCAAGAALAYGIDFETIREGLMQYTSPKKRFEHKGTFRGAEIVDDYAHHPSEIRATLLAAKQICRRELYVVFQPHTYSRTRSFFNDFVSALSIADHIILADIYAAREKDPGDVHSSDLAKALATQGSDAVYLPSFTEIEQNIRTRLCPDDLLITMGAGDVAVVGEGLLEE